MLTYLAAYYAFSIIVLTTVCVPVQKELNPSTTLEWFLRTFSKHRMTNETNLRQTVDAFCNDHKAFEKMKDMEHRFSSRLTWLIGVYVSIVARRFWRQVSSLPRMDKVCLKLNASIWVDPKKNEAEIEITPGITVKQFKMTIARLLLLSWTMALSNISPNLKRAFRDAKSYNDKRLLMKKEYYLLKGAFTGDDGWSEKWCVPLIWANHMLLQAAKDPNDKEVACITDQCGIGGQIDKFQGDLQMVLNHYCYKASRVLFQCMTAAMWFFVLLGIVGSQGDVFRTDDVHSIPGRLAANFPGYHIMKYLLLFGWILAAKDLQNPFGDNE